MSGWMEAAAAGTSVGMGVFDTIIKKNQSDWNRQAQKEQNRDDRNFQREQYNRERQDALSDYHMANEYNHPLQQMERLRQAGLNPNLVYGKGAETTAASIRGASAGGGSQPAPQHSWDPGLQGIAQNAINSFQDVALKQAQTDNIHQQTAVAEAEEIFKQANTAKLFQDTARSKFDLDQAHRLKDLVIEEAGLRNRKLEADTIFTMDSNQRQELVTSLNLQKTLQDITFDKLRMAKTDDERRILQQNLKNLQLEQHVKRAEAIAAKSGVFRGDPVFFRMLTQILDMLTD